MRLVLRPALGIGLILSMLLALAGSSPPVGNAHAATLLGAANIVPTGTPAQLFFEDGPLGATTVGSAKAATSAGPGYALQSSRLIGESGLGFRVYVDARAAHHTAIASEVASAVASLRRLGLNVSWSGYGTPKAAEGVIAVSEGQRGCAGAANRVANTYPYWMTLPNGDTYMYRSEIAICPRLYQGPSWQWGATVAHEMGHAMGLAHSNAVYAGSYQLMSAVNHSGVTTYKAGDVAGLRRLAANNERVKSEVAPIGRLETSWWNANNTITIQGWSLLNYYKASDVTVSVTDNGRLVSKSVTSVRRADVNKAYAAPATSDHGFRVSVPWTPGDHSFCITVTSTKLAAAHASLDCANWQS
ncbi:MAG TPA: hypothetical protein VGH11_05090 [Jatrophihabitans sp.]|jgi:hypothetical protein